MHLLRGVALLFFSILPGWTLPALSAAASAPEAWPQTTVSASLQLPSAGLRPAATELAGRPAQTLDITLVREAEPAFAPATLPEAEDEAALALTAGDEEVEETLAPVDPETLEEVQVLAGEETTPPDDEGVTLPATEVQFDFPVVENQKVQYYIDYFTGPGRKVFTRWMERSTRYLPYMQEVFASHGLPRDLAYLSIVESGLNPKAYSWAHASGPWQFIGSTGKMFGLESDYWRDERRDFEKSTQAAALFLKELHGIFEGDWYLAVASYNAGPGAVGRAIERSGSRDFWTIAHTPHLPEETKNYIPKLLAVLLIAKQPERYGFADTAFQEPLICDTVTLPAPTDVEVIARLAGSSYQEIKALNPELKRWCTPPKEENYRVNLPLGTKESFLAAYAELPEEERTNYTLRKVGKGETLKGLARAYRLSSDELLRLNALSSPKAVKAGRNLVIPLRPGVGPIPVEDLRDDPVAVKIAGSKRYTVKKGDNLSKIARRTGVSLANLKAWNRLSNKSRLKVGQVLLVGPGKGKGKGAAATVAKGKTGTKKGGGRTAQQAAKAGDKVVYKVKKGDTVYQIARQYDVTPANILSWNGLSREHVLQPGQSLTLRLPGRKGG